jgi:predicted thioesterase
MSRTRKTKIADFLVTGEGPFTTVYLLYTLTNAAYEWVAEHLPEDATRLGNAIAVEHRYIGDIVDGARNDGLSVR